MSLDVSVKKRPRKPLLPPGWWRWPLRALAALLALIVALTTFAWSALKREQVQGCKDLAAVIAETDAKDPRWRWHQIQEGLEPIADANNSVFVVQKVADGVKRGHLFDQITDGEHLLDSSLPINRRLDERRIALLHQRLAPFEDCVTLAASLERFPRGRAAIDLTPDVVSTKTDHVHPCYDACAVLTLDAERRMHEGKFDAAAARIVAMLHVGESLRDDPFDLDQRVRLGRRWHAVTQAQRLLACAELSDKTCRRLGDIFAARRNDNPTLTALRGERAFKHEMFDSLESGRASLGEVMTWVLCPCTRQERLRVAAIAYRYRLPEDHAFLLTRYNKACAIARLPIERQWPAWQKCRTQQTFARGPAPGRFRCLISDVAIGDFTKLPEAAVRDNALLSCAVVALAAERFRLAHKRWPASVNELCPAFLNEPPVDPFDGQPLRLTKWAEGVIIYSVGPDEQDDGGDLDKPKYGWPKDVGFRLFDPHLRGLSPLPRPVRIRLGGLVW